jgi:hypothetical protein
MSDNEAMLTRLAQHRERMAEAGNLTTARFDKSEHNLLTQEIVDYWRDMSAYYDREHDG